MNLKRSWWHRFLCRLGFHDDPEFAGPRKFRCPECGEEWGE